MINRVAHDGPVKTLLAEFPAVALLGARQVGKTTLARQLTAGQAARWFDLESPRDLAALSEPMLVLEHVEGLVVIDEVQRLPELFPILRVLIDRPDRDHRYLLLGSAAPALLKQSSETLAGRIAFHILDGFALAEIGAENWRSRWLRGGFPDAYLAGSDAASMRWLDAFIDTFLARDLPAWGVGVPATTMRRFWTMLAHWHGQTWSGAEFARAFGVADTTVRRYLDVLASTYVARVLQPWHENLKKRQVRSPKVYVHDTGVLHSLLGLTDIAALESHPKVGASFEGFALQAVISQLGAKPHECYFWATHQGAELDLLVVRGRERLGFEFKRTAAPKKTKSMRIAMQDLQLDRLDVVFPGSGTWPMAERIRAVGIEALGSGAQTGRSVSNS